MLFFLWLPRWAISSCEKSLHLPRASVFLLHPQSIYISRSSANVQMVALFLLGEIQINLTPQDAHFRPGSFGILHCHRHRWRPRNEKVQFDFYYNLTIIINYEIVWELYFCNLNSARVPHSYINDQQNQTHYPSPRAGRLLASKKVDHECLGRVSLYLEETARSLHKLLSAGL